MSLHTPQTRTCISQSSTHPQRTYVIPNCGIRQTKRTLRSMCVCMCVCSIVHGLFGPTDYVIIHHSIIRLNIHGGVCILSCAYSHAHSHSKSYTASSLRRHTRLVSLQHRQHRPTADLGRDTMRPLVARTKRMRRHAYDERRVRIRIRIPIRADNVGVRGGCDTTTTCKQLGF